MTLALLACGRPSEPAAQNDPLDAFNQRISCAPAGAPPQPACTLERRPAAAGELWTVRHPDGGFRRLLNRDGQVSAADGAEPLALDGADAGIGGWRYRLPAR